MGAMSPKQLQAVSCPTCGSGPKIMCKLSSGRPHSLPTETVVWSQQSSGRPTLRPLNGWTGILQLQGVRYLDGTPTVPGVADSLCARAVARLRWRQLPLYLFPNNKEIGEDLVPDKRFRSGQAREPKRRPGGVCQGPRQSRRLSTGDTRPY